MGYGVSSIFREGLYHLVVCNKGELYVIRVRLQLYHEWILQKTNNGHGKLTEDSRHLSSRFNDGFIAPKGISQNT
jgi:hypothetical protein